MYKRQMVSYDEKHNEDNGEDNRDGMEYNCSWNCGAEGTTRKKTVRGLRLQPVSYTHLDVYKRQDIRFGVLECSFLFSPQIRSAGLPSVHG